MNTIKPRSRCMVTTAPAVPVAAVTPAANDLTPYLDDWRVDMAERGPKPHSPSTIHQYHHKTRLALVWIADRPVTVGALYAYRLHRQQSGTRPRTLRCDFSAIYDFLGYLERRGILRNPPRVGSVSLPKLDAVRREQFSTADIHALFEAADKMPRKTLRRQYLRGRARVILALLAGAGLRRAELLALDTTDLHLDEAPYVVVRCGKGAQSRTVPLGEDTIRVCREWLETRREWCEQHGYTGPALLPVDSRRRLSDVGLNTIWDTLLSLADLSDRGLLPHSLRHWYASAAARAEDIPTAQRLLGHARLETTYQYLSTAPEQLAAAAESVSRLARRPQETPATAPPAPAATPQRPAWIQQRRQRRAA